MVCAEPLIAGHQPACKPGSVGHHQLAPTIRDGHSSGTMFAHCLKQPTRTAGLTSPRGVIAFANGPLRRPYSVLLPVGFTMPAPLPETRCALTAPFHPYPAKQGGSISVALSLGLPPPEVIRHRMSREPGLSSPATFRPLPERPSSRLMTITHGHLCRFRQAPSSQIEECWAAECHLTTKSSSRSEGSPAALGASGAWSDRRSRQRGRGGSGAGMP